MKISILCPTRMRPKFVEEKINSCLATCADHRNIEFIFYVDNDDHKSKKFFSRNTFEVEVKVVYGERIVLSEMWNRCYDISTGDILMHSGDDLRFRTKGWDDTVRKEFAKVNDRILFVFGRDGFAPPNFGTHGFIHRNWVEVIGYFVPPYFSSDYNDTWLNDVADMIDRKVELDIYTEHLHPAAGKATWDRTHKDRLIRQKRDKPAELYEKLLPERNADAKKLLEYIANYGEKK